MKAADKVLTVDDNLYSKNTQATKTKENKIEGEYIKWYASTFLYKAKGSFENWKFEELTLPDKNFEKVKAKIKIEISSLSEKSNLLVKHLKGEHFFDEPQFPIAYVLIDGAEKLENKQYKANATATIKGVTKPIILIFEVNEKDNIEVKGTAQIERSLFGTVSYTHLTLPTTSRV